MAYTSLIPVRRLDRAITYVRDKAKTTKPRSLEEAVDYALNRDKTESVCFETGLSCLCETAFTDMKENVQRWHKTGGVQGYHLVQSFAEGEVTTELAHQIGVELADQLLGGRYQAVVTTHLNTRHIHNHIVWCAVALDNGRKYHSNAKSYYTEVRARSDALCRQYGLSVIETPESERGKRQYAKWQAEANGQPSWRTAIRMDVDEAIALALTWRQFLAVLERKGYEIRMGRKYPTLRPPGKERFVRFKTLGKSYTPEAIRRRILYPKRPFTPPAVWHGRLHGAYRKARKLTGLWALYYRYLYELGALPRKPQRPRYAVRQDIRNLDKRIRQMEFLSRHEIDTLDQLDDYRQTQEQAVAALLAERRQLHRAEPSDEIKARLAQITQALKPLRRDIRLCRQIAEQSVQMRERLIQRAEKLPEQNPEQERTTEREVNREPNQSR
ncbi:relaxase/mobilization nuclease domain-containing protein [uncultured Gemmiger sp.]|uniref:relaxase/mobilization nuclease domain-containing protein n=1 Tax=uncultured Gemmiger sp. TaxID=1623490 RepID=UPI0025F7AB51|nr:relaxase/mobilization nuclease domain-containing protein [uncultured Gemmiger sp.]